MSSGSFPRWMFPLAAGLSVGVGAFWWALTLRHESARPAVLSDNGREWVIGGEAQPTLPAEVSPELRETIQQTLGTGRLTIPADFAAIRDKANTFARRRSAKPNSFRLRGPDGTAVADSRPHFRWNAVKDATAYRILIVKEKGGEPTIEATLPATTTDWSPAESLQAGAIYEWEIEATRDGSMLARAPAAPDAAASFRVLSERERATWERDRSSVGDSNLLRGIVAARAGLLEEAAEEFRALGRQNPRAEKARLFLEQVE